MARKRKSSAASARPFQDDVEYVEAEIEWVRQRLLYLGTRQEGAQGLSRHMDGFVDDDIARGEVARLAAAADSTRAALDARLAATRAGDWTLGLDRLVRQHGLDDMERQVLLLTLIPAIDQSFEDKLEGVDLGSSVFLGEIEPSLLEFFFELDLRGQLALRTMLSPEGRLVGGGLVDFDMEGRACEDFLSQALRIQCVAFKTIVGL